MVLEFRNRRARSLFRFAAVLSALAMIVAQARVTAQAGQAAETHAVPPQFEVAAIKPARPGDGDHNWDDTADRVSIENYTLRRLISVAYGLKSELQVIGGPKWIDRQAFDLVAKINDADVATMRKMDNRARHEDRNRMLQALLADRFGLKVSRGERSLPVYALVVAKSGAKVAFSKNQNSHSSDLSTYNGRVIATNVSMDDLAHDLGILDEVHDRVVVNRTGLLGIYDFNMNFTRDHGTGIPPDAKYPGLFTALKEQLGLELKPEKAPVEVIIVESASEPVTD
ncbi:MAG TPA: TIGR03435 family protein [Terracidiphilus sp.]|nr:TIGR03435 family protein [Terracidiphilus sp.]